MSEINYDFVLENIKKIRMLYEGEITLYEKIIKSNITKTEIFILFDNEWLTKWKIIVGYENLKVKCKNYEKITQELIDEVHSLFIKNNTKQKLDELGGMDFSKLLKKIGYKVLINEKSNFIPKLPSFCPYFEKDMQKRISVNSQISNGVIYIYDMFPIKNEKQKLILLYNEKGINQEFTKLIFTFEPDVKIINVIKKLKKMKIDEILNQIEYKFEIVKSNETIINQEEEEMKKIDDFILQDEKYYSSEQKKELVEAENDIIDKNEFNQKELFNTNNINKNDEIYISNQKIKGLNFKMERHKTLSIIFCTINKKILFPMICKNTDTIKVLEKEIYKKYPEISYNENYFSFKGQIIDKNKSLEKNNIKDGAMIIID